MNKIIVISLGGDGALESDLELVEATYEAMNEQFDLCYQKIIKEMTDDPAKQAWLMQRAKLDSAALAKLKRDVSSENLANLQVSLGYLQASPRSSGIQLPCNSACRQLIQAAEGTGALERGTFRFRSAAGATTAGGDLIRN